MIIIIGIVFMIISFWVSNKLKKKFKKYSETTLGSGYSGAQIAQKMLQDNGIHDVQVLCTEGELTDHYNPENKTVNLSRDVYYGQNAAAAAVAAHECGHALQHAQSYSFLEMRSAMVPLQNISAKVLNIVVIIAIFGGIFLGNLPIQNILLIIIACYGVITAFSLVTLPVEFDASKRALVWIKENNIATPDEHYKAKDALHWAAMTYVVAALGSLVTFLYYIMMFLGGGDD